MLAALANGSLAATLLILLTFSSAFESVRSCDSALKEAQCKNHCGGEGQYVYSCYNNVEDICACASIETCSEGFCNKTFCAGRFYTGTCDEDGYACSCLDRSVHQFVTHSSFAVSSTILDGVNGSPVVTTTPTPLLDVKRPPPGRQSQNQQRPQPLSASLGHQQSPTPVAPILAVGATPKLRGLQVMPLRTRGGQQLITSTAISAINSMRGNGRPVMHVRTTSIAPTTTPTPATLPTTPATTPPTTAAPAMPPASHALMIEETPPTAIDFPQDELQQQDVEGHQEYPHHDLPPPTVAEDLYPTTRTPWRTLSNANSLAGYVLERNRITSERDDRLNLANRHTVNYGVNYNQYRARSLGHSLHGKYKPVVHRIVSSTLIISLLGCFYLMTTYYSILALAIQ